MLKKIVLENFQSHKHSELELDPGVNVIVGPSDSGKTAIIRALRWLVWNRPLGEAFIQHGSKYCKVEIEIERSKIVREKERKNGKNVYLLDEICFNAVGTEPPEEVRNFLNLQEINISQQFDQPFLLSNSPGEVAQHFNKVARLDMIDIGMKRVSQWIRKIQQDISNRESQIKKLETQLLEYDYLPSLEGRIQSLEQMQNEVAVKVNQKDKIEELYESLSQVDEEITKLTKITIFEKKIDNILQNITEKKQKQENLISIKQLCQKLSDIEKQLLEQNNLVNLEKQINEILSKIDLKKELENQKDKLQNLISNLSQTEQLLNKQTKTIKQLEETFYSSFPDDICPLCGQKIKRRR